MSVPSPRPSSLCPSSKSSFPNILGIAGTCSRSCYILVLLAWEKTCTPGSSWGNPKTSHSGFIKGGHLPQLKLTRAFLQMVELNLGRKSAFLVVKSENLKLAGYGGAYL